MKVKGLPLSRLYFNAISEDEIGKKYLLQMTVRNDSILSKIEERINNLIDFDRQDIVTDVRVSCNLKYSNLQTKKLYILRGGVIKIDNKFYEYDFELVKLVLLNVPEDMKADFTPSPLIK